MRKIGLWGLLILAFVASLGGQAATQSADAKRFIGTWRLVSITQQDGAADPNRGAHPTGLIYYDTTGHMAVQIMPDRRRPPFASAQPTPEEAQAALVGYAAYFGTYSIDERAHTVTHHREGNINPGAVGDFVRRYEFLAGDRVALMPVENQNRLVWERIK